jgi:hypothetical protein
VESPGHEPDYWHFELANDLVGIGDGFLEQLLSLLFDLSRFVFQPGEGFLVNGLQDSS